MADLPTRNVVLTGFMGTGKSTVGLVVAEMLGFDFVDTDAVIEDRHGPIPEIFAKQGEAGFRQMERDVAIELAQRNSLVISTGGRLMLDEANAGALDATGRVFCLTASIDEIVRRVSAMEGERPLLDTEHLETRVRELMAERADGYARFEQVTTDDRSPAEIASDIIARLET